MPRADLAVAEAADGQRVVSERGTGERVESSAGGAGIADRPGGVAWAGKGGGVDPVEAVFAGWAEAGAGDAIGVLVAVSAVEDPSPISIRTVQSRTGAGGIALTVWEVRRSEEH